MKQLTASEVKQKLNLGEEYELAYSKSDENNNSIYIFSSSESHIITTSAEFGMLDIVGGDDTPFELPTNAEDVEMFESFINPILKQVSWCNSNYEKLPDNYKAPKRQQMRKGNTTEIILPVEDIGQRSYWEDLVFQGNVREEYIRPGKDKTGRNDEPIENIILGNNTYRNLTGCGATALGIVVLYWGNPAVHDKPYQIGCRETLPYQSIHRLKEGKTTIDAAVYNIESSEYIQKFDYENMYSADTAKKNAARRELFLYITKLCRTSFGPPGISSGAYISDILCAIKDLGFDSSARIIRIAHNEDAATNLIKNEIMEGRPVIISGFNSSGLNGHTFVIAGYKNNFDGISGDYFYTIQNTAAENKKLIRWYSLTPVQTSGVAHNWANDNSAIIGIKPKQSYPSSDIVGDLNNDGRINMMDATIAINYSIYNLKGKYIRLDLASENNFEGFKFINKSKEGEYNTLFLPLTGWKPVYEPSGTHSSYWMQQTVYDVISIAVYADDKKVTKIWRDGRTEFVDDLLKSCCVRLVYKGTTPEQDGAIDIGFYQSVSGKNGPESKKVYFAATNLGATEENKIGDYFTRYELKKNFTEILSRYGLSSNKWRLPTNQELEQLFAAGYEYNPAYDGNRDGFTDQEDINFIVNKILSKFYYIYHSSNGKLTQHTERFKQDEEHPIETTALFKNYVYRDCYYGGFYKSEINNPKGDTDLPAYASETAPNPSSEIKDLTPNYYSLKTFYLQEVPKVNTVPIILGNNFTAVPWPTPLTGASIEVNNNTVSGTFEESIQVTNQSVTETLQNYIVFDTALTQEAIIQNGITVTTLDGIDVKLTFTNQDFNLNYQSWNRVTQ